MSTTTPAPGQRKARRRSAAPPRRGRLHPSSLWREGAQLVELSAAPNLRRAAAWFADTVRPVTGIVSPLGWLLAGVVLALGVLGAAFGWQEAKIAALTGTLLLAIAVPFVLGRSVYDVRLDLNRTRVAVGDRAIGSMEVANASQRALLPSAMELPVGLATAYFHVPRLAPGQVHEDLFTIPTQRRAVIQVGPVRSIRQDPFALLRRQVRWSDPQELFVHPRTTALEGSSSGFIRDLEGLPTRDLSSSDVSFHALRGYVVGDDRRHIHWKSTARTGELMVRQFEETRRSHLAVALSTNTHEFSTENDFELAVSVAASIGLQAVRDQRNLTVISHDGPARTETGRNLLDDLTRIEGRPRRANLRDLARTTADAVPNASVFFLVTGSLATPAQLRAASVHIPVGVRAFALRCAHGLSAGRATIGDLTVISLGDLLDLGLVLRKAAS
ncbi:DUF58 domain-containing protein [Arthrobacter sp. KK5.5]|uniref:DUF58 domain-containing protein n=1 Tax=Arthrobacter sp. KK5.5 TaxID=3373084 RepID=UPI003EE604A4